MDFQCDWQPRPKVFGSTQDWRGERGFSSCGRRRSRVILTHAGGCWEGKMDEKCCSKLTEEHWQDWMTCVDADILFCITNLAMDEFWFLPFIYWLYGQVTSVSATNLLPRPCSIPALESPASRSIDVALLDRSSEGQKKISSCCQLWLILFPGCHSFGVFLLRRHRRSSILCELLTRTLS